MTDHISTPLEGCKTAIAVLDQLDIIQMEYSTSALYKEFMQEGMASRTIMALRNIVTKYSSPMFEGTEDPAIVGPPVPIHFKSMTKEMTPLKGCELAIDAFTGIFQLLHDKNLPALKDLWKRNEGFAYKAEWKLYSIVGSCENPFHYGEINIPFGYVSGIG